MNKKVRLPVIYLSHEVVSGFLAYFIVKEGGEITIPKEKIDNLDDNLCHADVMFEQIDDKTIRFFIEKKGTE